jgi:hypothetical protein
MMLRYGIKDDVMENYVMVQYQRLWFLILWNTIWQSWHSSKLFCYLLPSNITFHMTRALARVDGLVNVKQSWLTLIPPLSNPNSAFFERFKKSLWKKALRGGLETWTCNHLVPSNHFCHLTCSYFSDLILLIFMMFPFLLTNV